MATNKRPVAAPKWLKPGALVWCGFTGIVTDIAAGETAIMVQVESPKRLALGQRPEWLEYRRGVMRPGQRRQFEIERAEWRKRLQENLERYDRTFNGNHSASD